MERELTASELLRKTIESKKRFCIHVGGARAGKTVAICQYLVLEALKRKITITVVRKTLPSLKATTLRDFRFVMEDQLGIWQDENFNYTDCTYKFSNGSLVEFISVDAPQKVRGRKREILYCSEANELELADFTQLNIRTTEKVLCCYNPSQAQSWLYTLEDERPDECDVIHSTFLDNPFLADQIKREILMLEDTDPESWAVFGLGRRGATAGLIYTKWDTVEAFPQDCDIVACGIDFGYNSPSAVARVGVRGRDLFIQELLYESGLTSSEIAMRCSSLVRGGETLYCDAAEPDKILDLKRAGVSAVPAVKDVSAGITMVKGFSLHVVDPSPNLVRELGSYRWKTDRAGNRIDEPVKANDHVLDAVRYAAYSGMRRGSGVFDYTWASF